MIYFTDAFTCGERDTIPFLVKWRGRDLQEKSATYKTVLSVCEALEEQLNIKSDEYKFYWEKIKARNIEENKNKTAREKFLFLELTAANFVMLDYKERNDLMAKWANGEFTDIFTIN